MDDFEELVQQIQDLIEDVKTRTPLEERTEYTKGYLDCADFILGMVEEYL